MRQNGVRGRRFGRPLVIGLTRLQLRPSVDDFRNSASWSVIRPTLLALAGMNGGQQAAAAAATVAGASDDEEDDTLLVAVLERLVTRRSEHKEQDKGYESGQGIRPYEYNDAA